MPEASILFASVVIFAAFFVRALTGFGAGLISIPLLVLLWDVKFVVPLQLLFEIGISAILLPKVWKDIDFKHVVNLCVGLFFGNMAGAWTLKHAETESLKTVLVGLVLFFSLYIAWTAKKPLDLKIGHSWGVVFGVVGGFFGGAFGMSGPIVVPYLAHEIRDKSKLRATIIAVFLLASTWTGVAHWKNGLYSAESFIAFAWLTPAFLVATLLGNWAHFRVDEILFRRVVAGVLFGSAILLGFGGV